MVTIVESLAGGLLIGVAASLLWVANGRVAGISGIVGGIVAPTRGDVVWRALFVAGLIGGGVILAPLVPERFDLSGIPSLPWVALAGVLVGVGTRLGSGCTSGHGVCGVSRLSARSVAATVTFMITGALSVILARFLGIHP